LPIHLQCNRALADQRASRRHNITVSDAAGMLADTRRARGIFRRTNRLRFGQPRGNISDPFEIHLQGLTISLLFTQ
jgi:hypothetical protein